MILNLVRKLLAVTALVVAGLTASAIAPAQARQCMQRDVLLDHLAKRFKETSRAIGLMTSRSVLELFVSADGSWTIAVTAPDSRSCLVAAGVGWTEIPADLNALAEPAGGL